MSVLRTVADLRQDTLFRSGEPPTDVTGSFWTKSLEYLNRVQQQLMLGGTVAVGRDLATSAGIYAHLVDLPCTDWWWARRRGVFNTLARTQRTGSGTLSPGASSVTVTSAITTDVTGHYVVVQQRPTVLRVQSLASAGTVINFDAPYPDDAIDAPTLDIVQLEYDLAFDFLRFATPPYTHSIFGTPMDVSTIGQRNMEWPLSRLIQGRPTRAFRVGNRRVAFNTYDARAYRIEYEYVGMPTDLVEGGEVVLPEHHRMVLSVGAAMLICFDKGDGRAQNLASEYRELVARLVQEHRKAIGGGSAHFGAFKVRRPFIIPQRAPQSLGELYLV